MELVTTDIFVTDLDRGQTRQTEEPGYNSHRDHVVLCTTLLSYSGHIMTGSIITSHSPQPAHYNLTDLVFPASQEN